MNAASTKAGPGFALMKQTDVQCFYHMQMPRFLFFDERHKTLSLEAKVAYTFLLNRFQLSRMNGWVNENGEVFVVYTRQSLADEMRVSYRKIIEAVKELAAAALIWERRRGRGDANQIYLAKTEFASAGAGPGSAPFVVRGDEGCPARSEGAAPVSECAGTAICGDSAKDAEKTAGNARAARHAKTALPDIRADTLKPARDTAPETEEGETPPQDMQNPHFMKCKNDTSGRADSALQDMQNPHTRKKDLKKTKREYIKAGSVRHARARESPDAPGGEIRELEEIIGKCELWIFAPETAAVFENAIERLYFTENYRIGGAAIPQSRVRARLRTITNLCLQAAERKLAQNTDREIRNTTAYTMAVVFNSVSEAHSDLMLDPFLNGLKYAPLPKGIAERGNLNVSVHR